MLAHRFRTIQRWLNVALAALVVRGRSPGETVAAIMALTAARFRQVERLMDRFANGTLRSRAAFSRRAAGTRRGVAVRPPARPWPEHLPCWLHLVGFNHPSWDVRQRWNEWQGGQPNQSRYLVTFGAHLRAMVEGDAEMRGMLGISREARRVTRWLLRMSDRGEMPEILKETPRPRRARPVGWVRAARRRRDPRDEPPPAPPPREPGAFETPPDNLQRHEREARGMWVKPAIHLVEASAMPFTPTALTLHPRYRFGWER